MNLREISESSTKLAELASDLAGERGIGYREALSEIAAKFPDLVARAREEVCGVTLKTVRLSEKDRLYPNTRPDLLLASEAEKRARARNIPYSVALLEIGREDPELTLAARRQVLGLKDLR